MSRPIFLSFLLALLPGCAHAPPERTVRDFYAAMNDHDLDRAIGLLSDDYVFRDAAGTFSIPREDLRPLLEWDRATRSRASVEVAGAEGDTLRVRVTESNDFLDLLGAGPWRHLVTMVVRDGRIAATILDPPAALYERVGRALEPVLRWARATRPERLDGLVSEAGPVYDGGTAPRWIALLREAREAGVLTADEPVGP